MKKSGLILVILIVIGSTLFFVGKQTLGTKKTNAEPVDMVFLGDKQYKPTFDQSAKSAKAFYELYERGVLAKRAGKYNESIDILNQSLPFVGMGPEKAMVYEELAEIYRAQGNLEKELFYLEEIPKYTMSDRIKKESADRAAEIRHLRAAENQF